VYFTKNAPLEHGIVFAVVTFSMPLCDIAATCHTGWGEDFPIDVCMFREVLLFEHAIALTVFGAQYAALFGFILAVVAGEVGFRDIAHEEDITNKLLGTILQLGFQLSRSSLAFATLLRSVLAARGSRCSRDCVAASRLYN
jgi:hypothetical protein